MEMLQGVIKYRAASIGVVYSANDAKSIKAGPLRMFLALSFSIQQGKVRPVLLHQELQGELHVQIRSEVSQMKRMILSCPLTVEF